jgi:hypothetical protein
VTDVGKFPSSAGNFPLSHGEFPARLKEVFISIEVPSFSKLSSAREVYV